MCGSHVCAARIEGNYWGKGRWYSGKIIKVTGLDLKGKSKGKAADGEIPESLRVTVQVTAEWVEQPKHPTHQGFTSPFGTHRLKLRRQYMLWFTV